MHRVVQQLAALALAAAAASCAQPVRPVAADERPVRVGAPAPAGLEGAPWTVTGYADARGAWAAPLAGTSLTLAFDGQGVRGSAGCNGFRGGYALDGPRFAVEPLALTRKACTAPGVMEQERAFVDALRTARRWSLEGEVLVLRGADGARQVEAARARR